MMRPASTFLPINTLRSRFEAALPPGAMACVRPFLPAVSRTMQVVGVTGLRFIS